MANMSYCRFRNTLEDFRDCYYALCALATGEETDISDEEIKAAKTLCEMSFIMSDELGMVSTDGEFDNEECEMFFERLKEQRDGSNNEEPDDDW